MNAIPLKLLHPLAKMPTRGTPEAACLDVYASEETILPPRSRATVKLGIAWQGPVGFCALMFSRSGHAKLGVRLQNSVAVIDSDYRGEWMCIVANDSAREAIIAAGDRIAQVMLMPVLPLDFVQADTLDDTVRGTGGFGSTGTREMSDREWAAQPAGLREGTTVHAPGVGDI